MKFKFLASIWRDTDNHSAVSPASSTADVEDVETSTVESKSIYPTAVVFQDGVEAPAGAATGDAAQTGVQRIEAVTLSWSKTSLAVVYVSMWLLYFVNAFQSSITNNLTPFVLSGFESHSLIPLIAVVSNIMCAAVYLPLAKVLDIWGRPTGFITMVTTATVGLILMATTTNVETYCAAQVFYSVGFVGVIFSVDIITADTSSLRDRGLAFAFTSSPYIITALAGPAAAQGFYEKISWRWAFGTFAIILPFVAAPLFFTILINERRARKAGVLVKVPSGRTCFQSIRIALGIFLLAAGLVVFLLPFSLASEESESWSSPSIIAMLVVGIVLLIAFVIYERFFTPKAFIPYHLLVSRTVLGSVGLCTTYQIAYYCWGSYFSSYLQVVNNLTITQSGWILGVYDIISGCWLLVVGFLVRRTGRFRWLLMISVPLYALGVGLMIYFRRPHTNIGYIIMCQVFIALAGATITLGFQIAITAVADHGDIAALLALIGLFGYIGGAIGNSISGAIWTNTLPAELRRLLPASAQGEWEEIYNDLDKQLSYPMGDPVREAIIQAYGVAQTRMLIAGTAIMALAIVSNFLIKDLKVTRKQTAGLVF